MFLKKISLNKIVYNVRIFCLQPCYAIDDKVYWQIVETVGSPVRARIEPVCFNIQNEIKIQNESYLP